MLILFSPVFFIELFSGNVISEHSPAEIILNQVEWKSRNGIQSLEQQKVHIHLYKKGF